MTDVGTRLEGLRGNRTQRQFAALIGVPLNSYTNWLLGHSLPKMDSIIQICTSLGVSADWLLGLPERTGGGAVTVNAPVTGAVACVNSTATVGGDCSRCQLMAEHIRQITGRG